MSPSIGYIGFGNRISAFTTKPQEAFKVVKKLYTEELELLKNNKANEFNTFEQLSVEEKQKIKERIRKQIQNERLLYMIKGIFAFLLIIGLVFLLWNLSVKI